MAKTCKWDIPVRMTSTPVGYQRSPWRSKRMTVLLGSVRKYSPSSTCVPSDSSTSLTGSLAGTFSFSFPATLGQFDYPKNEVGKMKYPLSFKYSQSFGYPSSFGYLLLFGYLIFSSGQVWITKSSGPCDCYGHFGDDNHS